jgi:uncharacterized protein DUF4240
MPPETADLVRLQRALSWHDEVVPLTAVSAAMRVLAGWDAAGTGDPSPGSRADVSLMAGTPAAFLDTLAGHCHGLPADELTRLDRMVERKLWELDRADVHAVTGGSNDGFLYSRGFAVAMGREFCDAVAGDPEMGVPDAECEEMCYFFAHLCPDQFGEFPDTGSGISRESGSNLIAWIC